MTLHTQSTPLTDAERRVLSEFLSNPGRPSETLSLMSLEGFLFAVACSPVTVSEQAWMPQVFAEQPAGYCSKDEEAQVVHWLGRLYAMIYEQAVRKKYILPVDCQPAAQLLDTFRTESPLHQWAHGFMTGHAWLEEAWSDLPAEVDEEIGEAIMILGFFANEDLAREYHRDFGLAGESLEQMGQALSVGFNDALMTYAYVGQIMRDGE